MGMGSGTFLSICVGSIALLHITVCICYICVLLCNLFCMNLGEQDGREKGGSGSQG